MAYTPHLVPVHTPRFPAGLSPSPTATQVTVSRCGKTGCALLQPLHIDAVFPLVPRQSHPSSPSIPVLVPIVLPQTWNDRSCDLGKVLACEVVVG